jgi:hypothetical protein
VRRVSLAASAPVRADVPQADGEGAGVARCCLVLLSAAREPYAVSRAEPVVLLAALMLDKIAIESRAHIEHLRKFSALVLAKNRQQLKRSTQL